MSPMGHLRNTPPAARRRGEPLLVLGAILLCWIGMRASIWQAPQAHAERAARPALWAFPEATATFVPLVQMLRIVDGALDRIAPPADTHSRSARNEHAVHASPTVLAPAPSFSPASSLAPPSPAPPSMLPTPVTVDNLQPSAQPAPPSSDQTPAPPVRWSPRVAGGHKLLWMAAMANLPLPEAVVAALPSAKAQSSAPLSALSPSLSPTPRRWSADGWVLLRAGAGGAGGAVLPASYGATYGGSQAGAVLRYRLAPSARARPEAYLRAATALVPARERDLAAGMSLRPVAGLPVAVAAEVRASRMATGTRLRPAVFAVTELAPLDLAAGFRAEAYTQVGYVVGAAGTAFVDGQLRAERRITSRVSGSGNGELRAGVGLWGGAQKGAHRLDIGPAASLALPLGLSDDRRGSARMALDWRMRVAGHAAPATGAAITFSAGF